MTRHYADAINEQLSHEAKYILRNAPVVGAALRGEFGPERQLLALSEEYKRLKAAGETERAAAVKAKAYAIHAMMK